MTMFYLVRHGDTGVRNQISGRTPGVHLNAAGRDQVRRLADRFAVVSIDLLYSSPLERAVETSQAIASVSNLSVQAVEDLSEVDYGEWTGRSFDELSDDSSWQSFNAFRSAAQIPGGESTIQVQHRFVGWMEKVRRESPQKSIAVVSHQDPIKTAIAYYAGLHLDMFYRFEIGNASVSAIRVDNRGCCLLTLNDVGRLPS